MPYFLLCAVPGSLFNSEKRPGPPDEDELLRVYLAEAQALWRRIHNRVNLDQERNRFALCVRELECQLLNRISVVESCDDASRALDDTGGAHCVIPAMVLDAHWFDFVVHAHLNVPVGNPSLGSRPSPTAPVEDTTLGETSLGGAPSTGTPPDGSLSGNSTPGGAASGALEARSATPDPGTGASIFPPHRLRNHLSHVEEILAREEKTGTLSREIIDAARERNRFLSTVVLQSGCGLVEIFEPLDNTPPPQPVARPQEAAAPVTEISDGSEGNAQLLSEEVRQSMGERLASEINVALLTRAPVNMSNQPHEVSTEVLSEFARLVPGESAGVPQRARIIYADGSEAKPFPLRCLPAHRPAELWDECDPQVTVVQAALMSMRHIELDSQVHFAWYRNKEVSQTRSLAESDNFCFDYSLRQLHELHDAFWDRRILLKMYHTGFEPACVGFYRALVVALSRSVDHGCVWAPEQSWLCVVPYYFRGNGFDPSSRPWC